MCIFYTLYFLSSGKAVNAAGIVLGMGVEEETGGH